MRLSPEPTRCASEAARVHHAPRRRSSVAACSTRAAGDAGDWHFSCDQPPLQKTPQISPIFKSDSVTLPVSRELLIWGLKPIEAPLSDVSDVTVDTAVDRASGVEVCHTMLIRRTGEAWALPAADKKDAEINASAIRDFLAGQT
jgi:hypothetical protein